MKKVLLLLCFIIISQIILSQSKTIHVFVALCDNEFQGIVPVPAKIGNGKDLNNNLYWGCGYGVRSFFKLKTKDWKLVKTIKSNNPKILERILFKRFYRCLFIS